MQVDACKKLEETMHVHGKHHSRDSTFDLLLINFFQKFFWQKFELPNSGCGLQCICECGLYASVYSISRYFVFLIMRFSSTVGKEKCSV